MDTKERFSEDRLFLTEVTDLFSMTKLGRDMHVKFSHHSKDSWDSKKKIICIADKKYVLPQRILAILGSQVQGNSIRMILYFERSFNSLWFLSLIQWCLHLLNPQPAASVAVDSCICYRFHINKRKVSVTNDFINES